MSGPLVVVGDALLDRDVTGAVGRVAPDAPVPVLDERSATDRPGGAGLAALLAAAQDTEVALVTGLADDTAGARLAELLGEAGIEVYPMHLPGATAEKIRLRAGGQTLLRLDRGGDPQPPGEPPEAALAVLTRARAILVSDYGRGLLRQPALRAALAGASAPVVWDPHPRGPAAVPGARLATPNLGELRQLTGDAGAGSALSTATRAGHELRRRWRVGAVAATMGADGAVLCQAGGTPLAVPPPSTLDHVEDTCGAGDRFAATAALALADGASVAEATRQAVAAASAYVAAGGAAGLHRAPESRPAPARTAEELVAKVRADGGTVVATGGCFDILHAGHLATLQAARRLGDCLLVCLNSDRSVRGLKGPERPVNREEDRARLLAALDCVDAVVVFDEPTPYQVLARLRPDVWVKGGDYGDGGAELPEAELVHRWGGKVVTVPYLAGRSTTGTISAARTRGLHLVKGAV
ncbi:MULTISPECIES: PfkB family carbohydrate kinase [Micromonospora]|uniref:Bifunctional heptose 7-phosphate kinase/heptose 1-phosphate adenyltransferase n=1 Tax=Micromonospora solifontis TaxID=2487138 RepID=A0ABX9WNQ7_9ACTN|nr:MULTISPECIES: PfkB family carbohydrate kinase [Micromonospora]NES14859.1 bifunctional heptose 7-phosphate kinase/heptose 1-phosphate adenyltransferase [Micromonospora sp. PPF5-17B]NES35218.1 bifunctional heptose 7-phosphate kinase/heptose 1-phosphate adenyltransferase [Micromonospora solifontis]NES55213.1 bifunctional heptose 7-phosphate kinase/heptose 1-phosphate adenyltransferase [Micromonospora sp. PPF5-6]RNM01194.1 bifunctional heptose 7-phosphate kinase/heptose 1-phosphate adenyltransfe